MHSLRISALFLGLTVSGSIFAAAPPGAPSGTMGLCKDGSYSSSPEKRGACRGHKGVKDWYGDTATGSSSGSGSADKTAAASAPKPNAAIAGRTASTSMAAAPGGGAGQVWGNSNSKVYHCSGDKYYGKTSKGAYMSEADAKAKGYHADHGKACS